MTPITKIEETKNFKSRELIPLKCEVCKQIFSRPKNRILDNYSRVGKLISTCSFKCLGTLQKGESHVFKCKYCKKTFTRQNRDIKKKSKFRFCSVSCSSKHWNSHKTWGSCRSKLEKWIEEQLTILYPNIKIEYNSSNQINDELDIYIPSLKLAFELNGIFHYEPIFGKNDLEKQKFVDNRKFQSCIKNNISLCIIDTSSQKYFKKQNSQKFLDIITTIINEKLAAAGGLEPPPVLSALRFQGGDTTIM